MNKNKRIEILGGKEFVAVFSLMFLSSAIVVWCLTSALIDPIGHMSCHLLPFC